MAQSEVETRLPIPLSSFIGRQDEIQSLLQILSSGARLITLTGVGGVGKTRLALEIAAQVASDFEDGVVFVALDALTEAEQVAWALSRAVGVSESGERPVIEDLEAHLAEKQTLVCLDNCEHVLQAASQIADLLIACPRLHILATSREALRIRGEREFPLQPLQLPIPGDHLQPEAILQTPAVQLFVARANAVRPDFTLNSANASAIAEICLLLDGLPLAIELASALLRLFAPHNLLNHLKSNPGLAGRSAAMHLLAGGARDLPARQQTLRAAIDWSYNLLTPAEQRVFRWMSIFSGGCTLEAAEAICMDETDAPVSILDALIPLIEKNLLRSDQRSGEPWFGMLRTIQEYAREKLEASGELLIANERLVQYFLDWAERSEPELKGPDQALWLKRLELDHDNLRAGLAWSIEYGEIEVAYRLGGALWRFWTNRGYLFEGRQWLERILSMDGEVSIHSRIKVLNGAGACAWSQGDYDLSEKYHRECLSLREQIDDRPGIAASLHNLGIIALFRNDYDTALSNFRVGLSLYREAGDQWGIADQLLQLGSVLRYYEDFDGAIKNIEEGQALLKELGDIQGVAGSHLLLGLVALDQASYGRAQEFFSESKRLFKELGDRWAIAITDYNLGLTALNQHDYPHASNFFHDSLNVRNQIGDKTGIALCLEGIAYVAVSLSDMQKAVRLLGAADSLREAIGAPLTAAERENLERYQRIARRQLRKFAFTAAREAGQAMSVEQAVQYALEPSKESSQDAGKKTTRQSFPAGLTAREVEVLGLVAQGLSDAEVSESLVISPRTVNAHLTSIYNKLGVNSRVAATRFAVDHGLVEQ